MLIVDKVALNIDNKLFFFIFFYFTAATGPTSRDWIYNNNIRILLMDININILIVNIFYTKYQLLDILSVFTFLPYTVTRISSAKMI